VSEAYSDDAMIREFLSEAEEHFQVLEHDLLELEQVLGDGRPAPRELVDEMFRATHTLKGLAAMFEFNQVKELGHACESVFDGLRSGDIALDRVVLDLLFTSIDSLKETTARAGEGLTCAAAPISIASIGTFLEAGRGAPRAGEGCRATPESGWSEYALHRLQQAPSGSAARVLSLRWGIELRQGALSPESVATATGGEIIETRTLKEPAGYLQLLDPDVADVAVEVLVLTSRTDQEIADALGVSGDRIREVNSPRAADAAPSLDEHVARKTVHAVRVDIRRLDALMDLMGELVTARTRLVDLSAGLHESYPRDDEINELAVAVKDMSVLLNGVQERVMRMRMVPVGQLFAKFPRAVRDIARAEDKEIRLEFVGEETELDKRLIEQIEDPILHLLRNACDHGIELPYEREAVGKQRQGCVTLTASHEGGHIVLEVSDDGRGLDRGAIEQRARQLDGWAGTLEPELVAEVIMGAGFSTASEVTDVSGRGVGLDVVRRCLTEMGGTVEVDSSPGTGTTFRLRLPLTLAIVPALLVRIGDAVFCVPLSVVSEVMRVRAQDIGSVKGESILDLRSETLPLVHVGDILGVAGYDTTASKYFVVEVVASGHRVGLLVDELAGRQEIVVKNLEDALGETPGVSGATILGDGSVAPILDVERIARLARGRRSIRETTLEHAYKTDSESQHAESPVTQKRG